jgi:hypothetical protein
MNRVTIAGFCFAAMAVAASVTSAQTTSPAKPSQKPPATPAGASQPATTPPCALLPTDLQAVAVRLRATNPDPNDFIRKLDAEWGFDVATLPFARGPEMENPDEYSIAVWMPYPTYRMALIEAMRKRDPISSIPVMRSVEVSVFVYQIDAPDFIKVIVERDGKAIAPLSSTLRLKTFSTRLGATVQLHEGTLRFPCSAFLPGATVTVTAIPEHGSNVVREIGSEELALFTPQNVRK